MRSAPNIQLTARGLTKVCNAMDQQDNPPQQENELVNTALPRQRVLKSEDILRGDKEVLIVHHGEIYRLRETRNGKLILGK